MRMSFLTRKTTGETSSTAPGPSVSPSALQKPARRTPGDIDLPGTLLHPLIFRLTSRRDEIMRQVRLRCRTVHLGGNVALSWALGRYKFYVQTTDVGFGAHLMLDGFWEMWATEFLARCIRPGMRVFDLGANHGYFTLLAADLVGPEGKVLAFEPNPALHKLLRRNVDVNGFTDRVTLDSRALWKKSGKVMTFTVPEEEPKNGRITPAKLQGAQFRNFPVTSFALDDLADQKVDFIKADIEGAEEEMWTGMQKLLAKNPDVIFLLEFAAARAKNARTILKQMADMFPLQHLDLHSRVLPVSIDEIMARQDDWMLVLSRAPLPPVE